MGTEERFAALVDHFRDTPGVSVPDRTGPRRFGSLALKVDGSIFAMLTSGQLVVKLPSERVQALIADGTGAPFGTGKDRPMKEWVTVAVEDHDTWVVLAEDALGFVGSRRR